MFSLIDITHKLWRCVCFKNQTKLSQIWLMNISKHISCEAFWQKPHQVASTDPPRLLPLVNHRTWLDNYLKKHPSFPLDQDDSSSAAAAPSQWAGLKRFPSSSDRLIFAPLHLPARNSAFSPTASHLWTGMLVLLYWDEESVISSNLFLTYSYDSVKSRRGVTPSRYFTLLLHYALNFVPHSDVPDPLAQPRI